MNSPDQERQSLVELYAGMTDAELRAVAEDSGSLTETAVSVMQAERLRRHIEPLSGPAKGEEAAEWEDLVILKQFRDLPEATLAKGSLESAGIDAFLGDDNMVRMDWFISNLVGGIKLSVRPEDADAAMQLLEQPRLEEFEVTGVGSYQQPRCPQCQSADISYETLNKPVAYASAWIGVPVPVSRKRWKCHACGEVWKDSEEAEAE